MMGDNFAWDEGNMRLHWRHINCRCTIGGLSPHITLDDFINLNSKYLDTAGFKVDITPTIQLGISCPICGGFAEKMGDICVCHHCLNVGGSR